MDDRPLLLTDDPELLDDLLRLAAAAGVAVTHQPEASSARRAWAGAPLVVADDRQAVGLSRLPRHRDLVLVSTDPDDEGVWRRAVEVGAVEVLVLPTDEARLVHRLGRAAAGGPAGRVVGVIGGRGGAGASTLAAALAVTAAGTSEVVLLDADPCGGGLDLVLGAEQAAGSRWGDLARSSGRVSPQAVLGALPRVAGVRVLAFGREPGVVVPVAAAEAVLGACRESGALTVVDLPRGGLGEPWVQRVLAGCDRVLLVVPEELRAVAAARQVAVLLADAGAEVRLVTRGPAPGGLSPAAVARTLGLPVAGRLRPEHGLATGLELGRPPGARGRGPLVGLCRSVLVELLGEAVGA